MLVVAFTNSRWRGRVLGSSAPWYYTVLVHCNARDDVNLNSRFGGLSSHDGEDESICGGCGDRGWLEDGSNSCSAVCCAKAALQHHFKHSDFRPGQLEAVLPVLHCQDVFVRMATGSGKSLCMFLPPLCVGENAMGIVVSPLKALMEQQVRCMYCICECCTGWN